MYKKLIAVVISSALVWGGFTTTAAAAVVDTRAAMALEARQGHLAGVQAVLARAEVRDAMISLGVDPAQAGLRVAALSEPELARLQGQLDQLPAGGSILGLIGAVFVVLLILEITGVIDIFKKV
jgi:Family of unknown function (DUF6627)